MLKSIIVSAFGAGLLAGALLTAVQFVTTEPLILAGEVYEKAADAAPAPAATHEHTDASASAEAEHHHEEGAWEPADGFERSAYTLIANLLMGVAVSAVLLGAMTLRGGRIDAKTGLLWGVAGFFAASLLPSLGLSPELPGTAAAEIGSRQMWWLGTVGASAAGLALVLLAKPWWSKALGLLIAIVPHVIGAPEPPTLEAAYPAVLGAEFVVASLVVSALLWSVSGLSAGWLFNRLSGRA
jgi:cobalt transporter subunit CbtA